MNKQVIFTISSLNYLSYDLQVKESFLRYNHDWEFIIYLLDKIPDTETLQKINRLRQEHNIHFVDEIAEYMPFLDFALKYNVYEFDTAIKPFVFDYLFKNGVEKAIYIDPDIAFYNSIDELENKLNEFDIILTPHIRNPLKTFDSSKLSVPVEKLLLAGTYNLGFIAMKNSPNSLQCLDFWKRMLSEKGFHKPSEGLFCDQKWAEIFPVFFDKVYVLKDEGYNVSAWNLHEIDISKHDQVYFANDKKLVFYHFSGWRRDCSETVEDYLKNRHISNISQALKDILQAYQDSILKHDLYSFVNISFFYDKYPLGCNVSFKKQYFYNKKIAIKNIFAEDISLQDIKQVLYQQINKKHKLSKFLKYKLYVNQLTKTKPFGFSFYLDDALYNDDSLKQKIRRMISFAGIPYTLKCLNNISSSPIKDGVYSNVIIVSDMPIKIQKGEYLLSVRAFKEINTVEELLQHK